MQIEFTTSELERLCDALVAIQGKEMAGSRDYRQEDEDDSIICKLKALFKLAKDEEKKALKLRAEVLAEAEKIVKARHKDKP
jgi:hypothetical protein